MKPISFGEAEAMGFVPRSYSPYPPYLGEAQYTAHFLADMGGGRMALFFQYEKTGARCYAFWGDGTQIEGLRSSDSADARVLSYLQRNDICIITIWEQPDSGHFIDKLSLIKQVPVCSWSEQCDKRSPCCVFKN